MLTKDVMQRMNEADLRHHVIIPMMEQMGYKGVFEWHGGSGELGKDIVGWKEDSLGNRKNLAIVAKAERISAGQARRVVDQAIQAFNTGFSDPSTGEQQRVHECWVITNKVMKKDARAAIRSLIPAERSDHMSLLDGDELWLQVEKYLPVTLLGALNRVEQHLGQIETDYGIEIQIPQPGRPFMALESRERRVVLKERYPGQLEKEPVVGKALFRFPNTPEGRAKLEELQAAFATGAQAQIPGDYVQVEFPEAIVGLTEQIFGAQLTEITELTISSTPAHKQVAVRIDIQCDDGDSETLEYVEWCVVQAGTDEITFANDQQAFPIRVVHVVNVKTRMSNFTVSAKNEPIAAPVFLHLCKLFRCLGKPCQVRVTLLESGLSLSAFHKGDRTEQIIDQWKLELATDLVAVQEKVSRTIFVPGRVITEGEWEVINLLHTVLRRNELSATWDNMSVSLSREGVESLLNHLGGGQSRSLRYEAEEVVELFGTVIPLGRVQYTLRQARLDSETEASVREQLASLENSEAALSIRLLPGDSKEATTRYLDW